jgi:hypothetical protein
MLVAYGPEEQLVIAEDLHFAQLKDWSQRNLLCCPNCHGLVHVRGGPEKHIQLHFAHKRGECAWSTETESLRHSRGKKVLAEWLHQQFPQAEIVLEKRLPAPNRIADIFVAFPDRRQWAVEFQCAHLDIDEWHIRHNAYMHARIQDIWIIGSNRREKQDAFIEAIIATAGEIMFIDSLLTPPVIWIRWPIPRDIIREWGHIRGWTPSLEGWVGRARSRYGATLCGELQDVALKTDGRFIHANRSLLNTQMNTLKEMRESKSIDSITLQTYLVPIVGDEAMDVVLFPLLQAYLSDPELLTRFNYGRGSDGYSVRGADTLRIQKARIWLGGLALQGYSLSWLAKLAQEIPHVGPYAAFANYIEMLAFLFQSETKEWG